MCSGRALPILLSDEYVQRIGPMVEALRGLYCTEMAESLAASWVARPRKGPMRKYYRGKFTEVKLL